VVEAHWTSVHHGLHRFVCAQDEYSLLARSPERELIPALEHCGLGLLPYFPLASGLLSGKYRRDAPLPAGSRIGDFRQYQDRHLSDANWAIVEGSAIRRAAAHAARARVQRLASGLRVEHRRREAPRSSAEREAANWVLTPETRRRSTDHHGGRWPGCRRLTVAMPR
jgi:hypothetical protein